MLFYVYRVRTVQYYMYRLQAAFLNSLCDLYNVHLFLPHEIRQLVFLERVNNAESSL